MGEGKGGEETERGRERRERSMLSTLRLIPHSLSLPFQVIFIPSISYNFLIDMWPFYY